MTLTPPIVPKPALPEPGAALLKSNGETVAQMKSGFEPIPGFTQRCRHPEHNPPTMLVIPYGQQYRHVCPSCKRMIVMRAPDISL